MMYRPSWPAALLGLALCACGGGDGTEPSGTLAAPSDTALRRQALAAAVEGRIVYPTDLFNWAEQRYPQFLPGHAANRQWTAYTYRYYPDSQNHLGVADGQVYALGPVSNGELLPLGPASAFYCEVYADECQRAPVTLASDAVANLMAARTANALWVYEALGQTLMNELFDAMALKPVGPGAPPPLAGTVTLPCASGGSGTLSFVDADGSATLTVGDWLQASATRCVLDNGNGPEFSGTIEIRVVDGLKTENYLQTDATGAIDLQMSLKNLRTRFGVMNGSYRRASYYLDDRSAFGASSHFDELVVTEAGGATIRFTDVHLSFPGESSLAAASGCITVTMDGLGAVRNELSVPVPPAVNSGTLRYRPSNGTLRLAGTGYWLDVVYQANQAATVRLDNGRNGSVDFSIGTTEYQLDGLLKSN